MKPRDTASPRIMTTWPHVRASLRYSFATFSYHAFDSLAPFPLFCSRELHFHVVQIDYSYHTIKSVFYPTTDLIYELKNGVRQSGLRRNIPADSIRITKRKFLKGRRTFKKIGWTQADFQTEASGRLLFRLVKFVRLSPPESVRIWWTKCCSAWVRGGIFWSRLGDPAWDCLDPRRFRRDENLALRAALLRT